nr:methionine aminotransferase [Raoultella sp. NCTC 9187]
MIVSSFGKTYHVTGWRVGYCVAPAALMEEICKVHQFLMFSADTPMQYAFAEQMTDRNPGWDWRRFISKSAICCASSWRIRRSACCRAPAPSSCWRTTAISATKATAKW